MSALWVPGVVEPEGCDENGVPLDWKSCRACDATGKVPIGMTGLSTCARCGGHGSLRAAALAARWTAFVAATTLDAAQLAVVRCEGCGHPMSDGTWEGAPGRMTATALAFLRDGEEPMHSWPEEERTTFWSPCDEGCRHTGPCRADQWPGLTMRQDRWRPIEFTDAYPTAGAWRKHMRVVEASWRQVDVRTGKPAPVGHPHPMVWTRPWDLRPENLRLLCTRCWAVAS